MDKKQAIITLYQNGDEKIADIYDKDSQVADALNLLIDGFEYPDFSHKTINQVLLSYFNKEKAPFDVGRTLCHHALAHHIQENEIDLVPFFYNHSICNFGILTDGDKVANFVALATGDGRLLSKYKLDDGQDIYLITDFESENEPKRTTAMFVDDY